MISGPHGCGKSTVNFNHELRYNKIMKNLTTEQMSHAQESYHFALAAAGGSVDGVTSNIPTVKRKGTTRIICLQNAHKEARLAGLPTKRPYFLSDSEALARQVLKLSEERGCNAFTGEEITLIEEEPAPETFDPAPESELVPSQQHRCKDTGEGFCTICHT